ncbi:hypothetical protein ACFLYU_00400 [Candidatus Dependentiae bacterium]
MKKTTITLFSLYFLLYFTNTAAMYTYETYKTKTKQVTQANYPRFYRIYEKSKNNKTAKKFFITISFKEKFIEDLKRISKDKNVANIKKINPHLLQYIIKKDDEELASNIDKALLIIETRKLFKKKNKESSKPLCICKSFFK